MNQRQHRNVGFRGRYRRKVGFNLIDGESIVVIVVDLESPQVLLLIYVVFQFRSEEMTKDVLGEIEEIEFRESSLVSRSKLGEP